MNQDIPRNGKWEKDIAGNIKFLRTAANQWLTESSNANVGHDARSCCLKIYQKCRCPINLMLKWPQCTILSEILKKNFRGNLDLSVVVGETNTHQNHPHWHLNTFCVVTQALFAHLCSRHTSAVTTSIPLFEFYRYSMEDSIKSFDTVLLTDVDRHYFCQTTSISII